MWLPHSLIALLYAVFASGAITNTTVDDSDPSFTFTGAWNAITPSSPCDACSSKPDPLGTHDGTWHDGSIRSGVSIFTSGSFTFMGSAVYIFGIDQATLQPNITFTLGSIQQVHHYTGTERFVYDALFFSATGLASDQTHTVNWVFNFANTDVEVQAALFDYAVVTSGEEDVKTTSTPVTTEPPPTRTSISSNEAASGTRSFTGSSQTISASGISSGNGSSQSTGGAGQLKPSPSESPGDQASSPTVTGVGGTTTITAPLTSSRSNSKSNLGAIIGGVLGAFAVALMVIVCLYLRCRRARRIHLESDKVARSQFLRIEDYPLHSMQKPLPVGPVPLSLGRSLSKRRAAGLAGTFTSLSAPANGHTTIPPDSDPSPPPLPIEPPGANNTPPANSANGPTSGDFRSLEERLAMLEAQVAVDHHPPPYVHEDDD
ncbi:hypothetical protein B0H13DRAFT_5870 [Mycena leptocephala]|nr:hypothetical protein B0H13DRAFT_5870 [Mycena leptocephala]